MVSQPSRWLRVVASQMFDAMPQPDTAGVRVRRPPSHRSTGNATSAGRSAPEASSRFHWSIHPTDVVAVVSHEATDL